MTLHPQHRAHLATSAISNEILTERGYYSITSRNDLAHMAQSQRLVPAIGIPVYRLGERYTTVTRPDTPRETVNDEGKSKPIKYEWPAGTPLVLDVLPRYRDALTDTTRDLWLTEGAKKADALASHNPHIVPISLNGVWGWMDGKDADDNRCILPDFKYIALRGRRVVLSFDSDYQVNAHVRMALDELAKALEARGAIVGVLQLPHTDTKLGVDDAFSAGWTFDEIAQAVHWRGTSADGLPLLQLGAVEQLRRENEQLRERLQWMLAVLSNKEVPAGERLTMLFTTLDLWDRRIRHGNYQRDQPVPVVIKKIADESGQSDDVVGRHIKKIEKYGAWKRDVCKTRDAKTGDVRTEIRLTPAPILERPRHIKPPEPKNWGGKRETCTSCGSDQLVSKTQVYCEACGTVHKTQVRYINAPTPQDAGSELPDEAQTVCQPADAPTPQVAGSENRSTAPTDVSSVPLSMGRRNVGSASTPQDAGSGVLPAQHDPAAVSVPALQRLLRVALQTTTAIIPPDLCSFDETTPLPERARIHRALRSLVHHQEVSSP